MKNLHAKLPKEYQVKALCGLFGVSKQAYYMHDDDKTMLYMAQEEFVVSDRGCQYASHDYVNILTKNNVRISMTESGDPKDNAQAERINNTIKNELLKGKTFRSLGEVRDAVAKAVEFYNKRRPHMSIDMMTPVEARQYSGPMVKRWRSYREEAITKNNPTIGLPDTSVHGLTFGLRPQVNPCTE